jgi:hypothetical protein
MARMFAVPERWPLVPPIWRAPDLVDALEDQLTVYRDHSEISWINQRAGGGPVEPSPARLLARRPAAPADRRL